MSKDAFAQTSDKECNSEWAAWPETQERAIANGTYLIWDISSSIGHLMRTLAYILPLVRFLEVGLIMNMERFPAFRVAFEPGIVKWDVDPEPFIQRASGIFTGGVRSDGFHALTLPRGFLVLSDAQLDEFAAIMGIQGQNHAAIKSAYEKERGPELRKYIKKANLSLAPLCAWNMLLRRRYWGTNVTGCEDVCGIVFTTQTLPFVKKFWREPSELARRLLELNRQACLCLLTGVPNLNFSYPLT